MNQSNTPTRAQDPIEIWLTNVAFSHSQSKNTAYVYKKAMQEYCKFTNTTPDDILTEYENTDEKIFKRKHSQQIQQWITELYKNKMSIGSIRTKIGPIKSFYKYQNLPLGYVPQARTTVTYHNRDIEANEIAQIIALSKLREKAFYILMTQSGLRPCTIQLLQIKDIKDDLNTERKSYKINIPEEKEKGKFGRHPTFFPQETRKYLKLYLTTRTDLTPESLLFTAYNKPNTPINTKNISREFQHIAQKLQKTGMLDYEIRKAKPSEIRLYTLRKFFKRKCKDMGDEDTNYLMGHIIVGSNRNYAPKNDEYYRERYEKLAIPDLKIESPIPKEIDELQRQHQKEIEQRETTIQEQYQKDIKQRDKRIEELETSVNKILQYLKDNPRIVTVPIYKETAIKELLSTPEENQIDLTPDQQNIKLRRELIEKSKHSKPKKQP